MVAHENDEDGEGGHHHLVFKGPIDDSNKGMSLGVGVVEGWESESDSDSDSDTGEDFGQTYEGPKFTSEESNKLVRLFAHARTCPGKHKSEKHMEVCQSVKFMMLHIRDCQGPVLGGSAADPCPFPWCRKAKNLVYHIASCDQRATCEICGPQLGLGLDLSVTENYCGLAKLNRVRLREEQARFRKKKALEEKEDLKREETQGKEDDGLEKVRGFGGGGEGGREETGEANGASATGVRRQDPDANITSHLPVKTVPVAVDVQQKVVSDGTSSGDDADSGGSMNSLVDADSEGRGGGDGSSGSASPSVSPSESDTVTATAAPVATGLKRSGRETKGRKRIAVTLPEGAESGAGVSASPPMGKPQGRKTRSAKR